jgi:RimJ/RimL family protein N-acetyltransferase
LREFTLDDAPFILELLNSPGWLANIGDRNVKDLLAAESYIKNRYLPLYDGSGVGAYVIELQETKRIVGTCGLYKRPDLKFPDIGFALLPGNEKQGYAFEAASALMNFASERLGFECFYGITIAENIASIRLLKKLGLEQIDVIRLEGDHEDLLLFST